MRIINCRTNHVVNPVGYLMDSDPVFTWVTTDAKGIKQQAARIVVASGIRTDRGKKEAYGDNTDETVPEAGQGGRSGQAVASTGQQTGASVFPALDENLIVADTGFADLDSLGTAVPVKLSPRTRYYWTVTVRSDAGEEAASEVNYFETGKMDEPWQAKWIGCHQSEDIATERHPVFHTTFTTMAPRQPSAAQETKPSGSGRPEGKVSSARLYICGLGLYHAYINGIPVTQEYLTPYCTDYNKWIEYQTYDVTSLLKGAAEPSEAPLSGESAAICASVKDTSIHAKDACEWGTGRNSVPTDLQPGQDGSAEPSGSEENTLDVALGVGWYLGRFGFSSKPSDKCINGYYGDGRFKLLAELIITYADGSTKTIATDDTHWSVTRSNITFSNIYDGEHRDDTLPQAPGERAELLTDADGRPLALPVTERLSIPVLRHEILKPVKLIDTPKGEKVFDLGQNFAGIWHLKVHEPRGTKVHVQVGEVLQQGNFYNENLRTAKAEYWYTSDGQAHVLEPQFTFYGYRYVRVEGVHDLTLDSLEGIAVYSDITPAGRWECGDAKLNQLMRNISWGQKSNFVDVPTDCPQRDERMGWTADTQVFVPTALYLADAWAFYRKYLHDLALDQKEHDGMVPDVVPSFGVDSCAAVWGDAATFMPWNIYRMSGDKTILEKQLPSMKAWVDYIEKLDGDDHAWGKHFQYGDWLALDNPKGGKDTVKGGTDESYIAYVYYMVSASLVARAAEVVGQPELATQYEAKAAAIRQYVEEEYFTPNGRCAVTTMTGYILALYFNLTSDREKTTGQLVRLIHDAGNKFRTGFVGTPMVSRVLSAAGEDKLAYTIIHNEEYPGWLYEINLGATTVWERWNSMEPDGSVSSTGMNSFNHYAYGSIGQWMWETMAGIRTDEGLGAVAPDKLAPTAGATCHGMVEPVSRSSSQHMAQPGFRHAVLRPTPDYKTKWVKASYASAAGTWQTAWEVIDDTHVHVTVTVPFNCTATLILPYAAAEDAIRELSAGTYDITYTLAEPLRTHYTVDNTIAQLLDDPAARAAVMKINPQIAMVPQSKQGMTLRALTQAYAQGKDMTTFLAAIDQALATIG